jgi:hypothetical protein
MPSSAGIFVTLVHGTWGRGLFPTLIPRLSSQPRWFEEKSVFRTQLQTLLGANDCPVVIREFHWSGSNSIAARQRAASTLAAELQQAKSQVPEYTHAVIGHSHGGNVALAALSKLGDAGRTWLLVSLATPFLSIKDVDLKSPLIARLNFFLFVFYSGVMGQVFPLIYDFRNPEIMDAVQIALPNALLLVLSWFLIKGWNNELLSSKSNEVSTDAVVLVLRSIDDEAKSRPGSGQHRIEGILSSPVSDLFSCERNSCDPDDNAGSPGPDYHICALF